MESLKQRIDTLPIDKMRGERKTHPNLSTSGIDLLILEEINSLVKEEVKTYKTNVKDLDLINGEMKLLFDKQDENSQNRLKELQIEKSKKESYLKEFNNILDGGELTKKVIEKIKNKEVANPKNSVKENLQLVGYVSKEPVSVTNDSTTLYVQKLIQKKINNFDLRKDYFKKNINAFDVIKKQEA